MATECWSSRLGFLLATLVPAVLLVVPAAKAVGVARPAWRHLAA